MKQFLLILIMSLSIPILHAQDYVREMDKKSNKVILRGKMNFADIQKETVCKWFVLGVNAYKPNEEIVERIKPIIGHYRLVIFGGTWCSDTQLLLPQLYKILKAVGFDMNAIEMYGVNRAKESLNLEHKFYNIINVPTIIVMHQYREVGRIIESVHTSIEEDLLAIIEKDADQIEKKRLERFK